jgi:hypothetical protein
MSKPSKEDCGHKNWDLIEDQWDIYIDSIARGNREAADAALIKIETLNEEIKKYHNL